MISNNPVEEIIRRRKKFIDESGERREGIIDENLSKITDAPIVSIPEAVSADEAGLDGIYGERDVIEINSEDLISVKEERLSYYKALYHIGNAIKNAISLDVEHYLGYEMWEDGYKDKFGTVWVMINDVVFAEKDGIKTPTSCPMCHQLIGIPTIIMAGKRMNGMGRRGHETFYNQYGYCAICFAIIDDLIFFYRSNKEEFDIKKIVDRFNEKVGRQ